MSHQLHDFRIESDNLILLSFTNGTSARVSRSNLADYLSKPDLAQINKAMSERHKFIKRVLPPTAAVLLAAGVLVFGAQDVRQLTNRLQPAQLPAQQSLVEARSELSVQPESSASVGSGSQTAQLQPAVSKPNTPAVGTSSAPVAPAASPVVLHPEPAATTATPAAKDVSAPPNLIQAPAQTIKAVVKPLHLLP
ncbi:MAG TPA: hypothetical protein VMR98_02355 [Candidatus Polarisedimenticolaceae bacterium]|nr:hypothetical protein [Candidatus Polarisedimenticolaceae bacterium]